MNLLVIVGVQILLLAVIISAIVYKRFFGNEINSVVQEQKVNSEPEPESEKVSLPNYSGTLTPDLATFLYSHENTVMRLSLELDAYESLEIIDWMNDMESMPIFWFSIEHDHGGTELGLFANDQNLHINNQNKRSVKIMGLFQVDSLQGPKDGWMSVTIRSVV